ncbi:MAG: DUF1800 domain-containing protein [Woeseiaceae bacterium]
MSNESGVESAIAANRFGLGAKPGDLAVIKPRPQSWLLDQIAGPSRIPADIRDQPDSAAVLADVDKLRREQRNLRRENADDPDEDFVKNYGRTVRRLYIDQVHARYRAAAATDYPFHERLVHFWSNHFAISADKQPIPAVAGLFEAEAVRPNVSGNFADMLLSVEQHPAMIVYLDNQRSVGPGSRAAKLANRRSESRSVGLNENLAREILELHTLGVGGGYSQQDVTAFARVITGWSIGGAAENGRFAEGKSGTFEFREIIHEPGSQVILGKKYNQSGLQQGEAVLRDLAKHPATARHIASKLARHFVADEPPAKLVDKLAAVYLDSGGELPVVYQALVTAPESWVEPFAKYKTPHDFVVSTFRAFDHDPDDARFVIGALDLMGQTPYRPGSPAGWPDTAEQWGGADALYKRIEWCNTVANYVGSRVNPVDLGDQVLGPTFRPESRRAIARAESLVQGMTMLLAAPDFQRR